MVAIGEWVQFSHDGETFVGEVTQVAGADAFVTVPGNGMPEGWVHLADLTSAIGYADTDDITFCADCYIAQHDGACLIPVFTANGDHCYNCPRLIG